MTWLSLALIGMFIWSIAAVIDRFALHGRIQSKRFYVVVPALLQFPLVLVFYPFFEPTSFDLSVIAISVLGGLLEVFLLYYLYVAVSSEEIGRVFPLMSVGAVFTLLGGWLLLGDTLEQRELFAFSLLIAGGVIIALKKQNAGTYRLTRSIVPLFILSFLGTAYTLALRYAFLESDFATGFFFSRIGFFVGGLVVILLYWSEIKKQWHALKNEMRSIVVGNQIVSFSGHAFYFSALALANAALVQAVLSIQGIVIFVLASIVSMYNPKLVGESLTRHDVIQKILGISIMALALNLLI